MEPERLITLRELCRYYDIDLSFIRSLNEFGLVEIVRQNEEECLDADCLGEVEKLMRMHYDLEINMAGIDVIHHLLHRMDEMQRELMRLRGRLS